MKQYLTSAEAADRAEVSAVQIAAWCRMGVLPHRRNAPKGPVEIAPTDATKLKHAVKRRRKRQQREGHQGKRISVRVLEETFGTEARVAKADPAPILKRDPREGIVKLRDLVAHEKPLMVPVSPLARKNMERLMAATKATPRQVVTVALEELAGQL